METLRKLAEYDGWANQIVFKTVAAAANDQIEESDRGTFGSIRDTLTHLVGVAEAYLSMLQDSHPETGMGTEEEYFGHDLAWFGERAQQLSQGYADLLASHDNAWLETRFVIPWFSRPLSRRDGLIQVFTHSAQHRAQVLSALGSRGYQVPDVDYVMLAQGEVE